MGKEERETVKAKRHTPNQVIRKLREAELMLAEGKPIAEVAKALEVSEVTFHRWRNQYGGMKADDAKRLKELERDNASLKRPPALIRGGPMIGVRSLANARLAACETFDQPPRLALSRGASDLASLARDGVSPFG